MPFEMKVYSPTAIHVEGNSETGQVHAKFRVGPQAGVCLVLDPPVLVETAGLLLGACSVHPDATARAGSQIAGIREIAAHFRGPGLLTLRYELAAGLALETSIEAEAARQLLGSLQQALAAHEANRPPNAQH